MPGIDFACLRRQVSLAMVLDLIGFTPTSRRGIQVRGPCPVHGSQTACSRSFSAHLGRNCWHCFRCGAGGNTLDLYQALTKLPLYEAAVELCGRLGLPVPWRLPAARSRPRRPLEPTPPRAVELDTGLRHAGTNVL